MQFGGFSMARPVPFGLDRTFINPISPPPVFASSLHRLLRQGYEGQEGYARQAGPATGTFNGLHPSKFLAVSERSALGIAPAAR